MKRPLLNRREFNQWLLASVLGTFVRVDATVNPATMKLRVAAIQMAPELGNQQSNLKQAEQLINEALNKGVQWIILPEMFTTGAGFHNDMLKAIQPFNGPALQLLKKLSTRGNAIIGGSFLARQKQDIFNTFVLVSADGNIVQHNKDLPTYWENCYYKGGNDDGVLATPIGNIGAALCWELIRSNTAKRLYNKVKLLVAGSCWWTLPDDADPDSPRWAANLKMIQDAPRRMARMLGVAVIHGSNTGHFEGFYSPDLPDTPYHSSYLGETMIVDAKGKTLARRSKDQGEGVIVSDINLSNTATPSEKIPETFWIPEEMPDDWKQSFERWFERGADYYERVTKPYLKTGVINDYEPPYMR